MHKHRTLRDAVNMSVSDFVLGVAPVGKRDIMRQDRVSGGSCAFYMALVSFGQFVTYAMNALD